MNGTMGGGFQKINKAIEELESQVDQKKRLVNELCREYGQPPRYPNVDTPKIASMNNLAADIFYGRPLASVIREYLLMRGPSDKGGLGVAEVPDIYEALKAGGYKFDTKDRANAMRGLRIALTKNTNAFHRVGDTYGLSEWYPAASRAARNAAARNASAQAAEDDEDQNEAAPDSKSGAAN